MEQKENLIDKDIELIVVLPGGKEKITTVHGRPKKRQAPLPPMAASQSMPKDLSSMQADPLLNSQPESKQELPQLSRAASSESSLKRTKRKAPLPPSCKSAQDLPLENGGNDSEIVANGEVNKQVMETSGRSNAVTFQPKGNDNLKDDRKVIFKNEETCTENEEIVFASVLENKSINECVKTSVVLQSKPDEQQVTPDQDAKPTVFQKKMQDAAIQASVDISVEEVNKTVELNGCSHASPLLEQSLMKRHLINSLENEQCLPCSNASPCKQEGPVREIATSTEKMVIECVLAQSSENDEFQNIAASPPVYKRDSESKPKPSNEVTRDYIPKIGMTTYKIVPQKSLEKLRFFEVEVTLESPSKTPEEEETSIVPVQAMRYESDPQQYLQTALGPTVNESQMMQHSEVSETTENVIYATTQPAQECSTEKEKAGFDSQLSSPSELDDHPSSPLDINQKKVPPAVKPKPGSFRLSLQKKPPGYYVTSAAAKSPNNCAVSAANEKDAGDDKTDELITETECGSPPLPTLLPAVPEVSTIYQSPPDLNRSDQPVSKFSRPLSYPYKDASVPIFQKFRSFTGSKTSTRTSPSPFALAVSSAVKRSQSLNKGSNFNSQSFQKLSNASLTQSSTTKELKEHSKDFNQSISSTRTFEQVIKVYNENETSRALEVPSDITARDVCQLFILKNHCIDDHSWTLYEHLPYIGIERTIEDHEPVIEVQSRWGMETESRLSFRKNYAKYEFFKKPLDFFPEHMVSVTDDPKGIPNHSQLVQEPRHLQFFAEFSESDVYCLLAGRKMFGAPTDYGFCIKININPKKYAVAFQPNKSGGARDLKLLCADEEQIRTCWITAIRLFKRSISENSLVAMDFSGHKGRVIENPSEALSVAVEEGLSWRLEEDGELFFSMDEGHTRFTDLIQLVEFYQLNKGMLPCKLKHHCVKIAL
ncbi:GRB14 protein, partial [Polypterus senegalus]